MKKMYVLHTLVQSRDALIIKTRYWNDYSGTKGIMRHPGGCLHLTAPKLRFTLLVSHSGTANSLCDGASLFIQQ